MQVILVQYVSVNAALMLLGNNFYFQPPVCVGFLLFGCLITLQLDTGQGNKNSRLSFRD